MCTGRRANPENARFYRTAAAAAESGYRPCLRCRPELSPGVPAWSGSSPEVTRALRLVAGGAIEERGLGGLALALGVTVEDVERLFHRDLGASVASVIRTRRLHLAKRLLDASDFGLGEIALAVGFRSRGELNAAFRAAYGRTPRQLRCVRSSPPVSNGGASTLRLDYRPQLAWGHLVSFLGPRATPGVEAVRGGEYRRSFCLAGDTGVLAVRPLGGADALELRVYGAGPRALLRVADRVRRLFDLDADPKPIRDHLRADHDLRIWVDRLRGVRVPGAWEGFELVVRAIVGQQVSVKAATAIAGRLAARYGERLGEPHGELDRLFPTPRALANASLEDLGMPGWRAETLRRVARAVVEGRVDLAGGHPKRLAQALTSIRGVGDWTAQYVAMRMGEADAFPADDLGLRRSPANGGAGSAASLLRRAERWRPWRAYAAMTLWYASAPLDPPRPL